MHNDEATTRLYDAGIVTKSITPDDIWILFIFSSFSPKIRVLDWEDHANNKKPEARLTCFFIKKSGFHLNSRGDFFSVLLLFIT